MATTAELLSEAKSALHKLMTGQAVVEVRDSNGETVRYTRASVSDLSAYISRLEQLLAEEGGATSRGPLRVWM